MGQVTVRIDSRVHRRVKERAHKSGYKIGRLTERLLEEWLDGRFFFADECTVRQYTGKSVEGVEEEG